MKSIKKISRLAMVLLLPVMLLGTSFLMAQSKAESRQEKKEREAKEQDIAFKKAKAAILDTAFVVPAQTLKFRNGSLVGVSGTINYLQVIGNKAVLQIGSHLYPGRGLNNVGGVTLKGNITNLKIKEKKDRVFMTFTLTGLIGTARVAVSIKNSRKATVDVDGMFSGRFFTMWGDVLTLKEANVYEGSEW